MVCLNDFFLMEPFPKQNSLLPPARTSPSSPDMIVTIWGCRIELSEREISIVALTYMFGLAFKAYLAIIASRCTEVSY
jgi:hypothetical protein